MVTTIIKQINDYFYLTENPAHFLSGYFLCNKYELCYN